MKIVIFRNGGKLYDNEKFYIDNTEIEFVNKFTYMGLCLSYNGKYAEAKKNNWLSKAAMWCLL